MQNIAIAILAIALSFGVVTLLAKLFKAKRLDVFLEQNLKKHAVLVNITLVALTCLDLAYNYSKFSFTGTNFLSSLVIGIGVVLGINMLMFPSLRKNKFAKLRA